MSCCNFVYVRVLEVCTVYLKAQSYTRQCIAYTCIHDVYVHIESELYVHLVELFSNLKKTGMPITHTDGHLFPGV